MNSFVPLLKAGRGGITSAKLTREWGPGAVLAIKAEVSHLGEPYERGTGQPPHFSVTCDVVTTASRRQNDIAGGGCLHELALEYWPELAQIVALHLSHADDGSPAAAEANGFYWLAGIMGGLGERYHGGNADLQWTDADGAHHYGHPPRERLVGILADHWRVTVPQCEEIVARITAAAEADQSACDSCAGSGLQREGLGCIACGGSGVAPLRLRFKHAVELEVAGMRARWREEARAGLLFLWEHAGPPDLKPEWHRRTLAVLGVDLPREVLA